MKTYYVYMMASLNNNVLYIGVTNNLIRWVYERKNEMIEGFTKRYNCKKLVWYKEMKDINTAILWRKKNEKVEKSL